MKITILVPHYRTGKMTAYSIAQILKYKGRHELDIIVIDNNAGDGSIEYLEPFKDQIRIVSYPLDLLQSHGVAFDYVLPTVNTEWVVSMESDSFPESEKWLDFYERLTTKNVDCAGSVLQLSGGQYVHPCGMLFKKSSWMEAWEDCEKIKYLYFPNMSMKEGFACHLMVEEKFLLTFLDNPEKHIILADGYKPYDRVDALAQGNHYSPATGPFHNGMGGREESVHTYGQRTIESDMSHVMPSGEQLLINRIGYEPGQWFSYWHFFRGKKVYRIGTKTKWINDIPGTQQEYTLTENDFRHLWGISAWKDADPNNEFAKIKQPIPDVLYETLPEELKIKNPAE